MDSVKRTRKVFFYGKSQGIIKTSTEKGAAGYDIITVTLCNYRGGFPFDESGGAEIIYLSAKPFGGYPGTGRRGGNRDFPENQPRDPGDTGRRRICRICQTGRGTVCPDRGTVCG